MGLGANQVSSDGLVMSQDALKAKELGVVVATRHKRQLEAPQVPQLRCPRCDSNNTKFCYYNNYSKSQPRHFCKSCRRHWTNGGTLRNVPIGGGRKTKRPKSSHPPTTSTSTTDHQPQQQQINMFNSCSVLDSLLSLPPIAPLNMVGSYDNTAFYPLIGQEENGVVGFGDGCVGPWQFCPSVMETEAIASINNNSSYNNNNLGSCLDEFSAGFFAATQPYQDLHF